MARTAILIVSLASAAQAAEAVGRIPREIVDRVEEVAIFCASSNSVEPVAGCEELLVKAAKIQTFRLARVRGYGAALKQGIRYVVRRGFEFVVIGPADAGWPDEILGEMLGPLETGEADLVLGSRRLGAIEAGEAGKRFQKTAGHRGVTLLENLLSGLHLSDFHPRFRAFRVSALAELPLARGSDSRVFETQLLLECCARRLRIKEMAVAPLAGGKGSRGGGAFHAASCLWESAAYRVAQGHMTPGSRYAPPQPDYRFHEFPGSSHRVILDLLADSTPLRILDVGTASGYLDRELQARGHSVTGIECHAGRAAQARDACVEMIVGDVEALDLGRYAETFDCAVLADVLEHMPRPEEALRKIAATVKPGGRLIVCVPNVANLYVRLNLLMGRFRYQPCGILDATHLRFFTLTTLRDMVEGVGLEIRSIQPTPIPLPWLFSGVRQQGWFRLLYRGLRAVTRVFRRIFAYQFVAVTEKPGWLAASERPGVAREAVR